jgi:hypothetical protein
LRFPPLSGLTSTPMRGGWTGMEASVVIVYDILSAGHAESIYQFGRKRYFGFDLTSFIQKVNSKMNIEH